jgi:hypothetical protein
LAFGWNSDLFGRPNPAFPASFHQVIFVIDVSMGSVELIKGAVGPGPAMHSYYEGRARYSLSSQPWEPDGTAFVYSDGGRICTYAFETRETTCPDGLAKLVAETGAVGADYPGWSPTGEWIGFILAFESVFCNPLAVISPDADSFRYTDAERGDCAADWGIWSPQK